VAGVCGGLGVKRWFDTNLLVVGAVIGACTMLIVVIALELTTVEVSVRIVDGLIQLTVTLMIALIASVFAAWYSQRTNDGNLILQSFKEYNALYRQLNETKSLHKKHSQLLDELVIAAGNKYNDDLFDIVASIPVSDDEWESPREIKNYFKSRITLLDTGFFSESSILATINRGGSDSIIRCLKPLDIHRFYTTRSTPTTEDQRKRYSRQYDRDLRWYDKFKQFQDAGKIVK
jgi:hypothetical protein